MDNVNDIKELGARLQDAEEALDEALDAMDNLYYIVKEEYEDDPEPEDLPSWARALQAAEAVWEKHGREV